MSPVSALPLQTVMAGLGLLPSLPDLIRQSTPGLPQTVAMDHRVKPGDDDTGEDGA
jgi:hypothetical protein